MRAVFISKPKVSQQIADAW